MEEDDKKRCNWCMKDQLYRDYHDFEWGEPSHDDQHLFEHLVLETFQAGLSWHTILKRREQFRMAFDGFEPTIIAGYDENKQNELMQNEGIIRNKAKIKATVGNARAFLLVQKEWGSFDNYLWHFTDNKIITKKPTGMGDYVAQNELSILVSKDMKKRGFSFVGPVGIYAYLQAVGVINEHMAYCYKA